MYCISIRIGGCFSRPTCWLVQYVFNCIAFISDFFSLERLTVRSSWLTLIITFEIMLASLPCISTLFVIYDISWGVDQLTFILFERSVGLFYMMLLSEPYVPWIRVYITWRFSWCSVFVWLIYAKIDIRFWLLFFVFFFSTTVMNQLGTRQKSETLAILGKIATDNRYLHTNLYK